MKVVVPYWGDHRSEEWLVMSDGSAVSKHFNSIRKGSRSKAVKQ